MAKKVASPVTRRCVIYARVSTTEQREEGFSLDAQLELLRSYSRQQGMTIVSEYVDAESGSRTGRTRFGEMMEALAAGRADTIVVEKTDRLYRNFSDFVKVDDLHPDIHFVKENMVVGPTSRSSDKFIHSIKVCLAKNFSDNLREETIKGMVEKAKQGIWPSSAPLGYLNVHDGPKRTIVLDPKVSPLIRKLFEAYAGRVVSLDGATGFAKQIGLRSRKGAQLSKSTIAWILENPIYMGVVRWNGTDYPGIHEPIIDVALYNQVQDIMHARSSPAGFGKRTFAYKGLFTCGHCGCAITAEIKKGKYIYYHCTGMRDKKCPGKAATREEALTEAIGDVLSFLLLSDEQFDALKEALRQDLATNSAFRISQTDRIEKELKTLRARLDRMYLDKIDGNVSDDVYQRVSAKTQNDVADLELQMKALGCATAKQFDLGLRILELARTAPLRFKRSPDEVKRELLLELVESASITDGLVKVQL